MREGERRQGDGKKVRVSRMAWIGLWTEYSIDYSKITCAWKSEQMRWR